jgi:hypothetical protein
VFFFFDRLLKNLLQSAIGLGAFLSFIMVIIKSLAWWKSKSMSIGGSLLDSVIDCFTSLMNFFVLRYARSPADKEHRFGHGKAVLRSDPKKLFSPTPPPALNTILPKALLKRLLISAICPFIMSSY